MEELRKKLINAHKQGNFLEIVYQTSRNLGNDRKSLGNEIAILHNEGAINAVAEFRQLSKDLKGTDFFLTRSIFEDALPAIIAPVALVMDCVKHLVAEAGNDMAASWSITPFIKYCEADINRPKEVLRIAENGSEEWLDFIAPAIIAGSNLQLSEYVPIAITLTHHENLEVRIRAVFAIGKLNYCNNTSLLINALRALESIIKSDNNDRILGTAIKSAYSLYISDTNMEVDVIQLIKIVLTRKDDFVLQAASELFYFYNDKYPSALLDILLGALKSAKPQNKDTLANIENGLRYLVKSNLEEKAISFLENFLIQNKDDFSIKSFTNLINDLFCNHRSILNKIATRWFLSKKIPLCRAVMEIIQLAPGNDIILSADLSLLAEQPEGTCLFIAKKVIGWLFHSPTCCTSFIVSIIDISSSNEIDQLTDLLFSPLLINYPGKAKKYLNSVLTSRSLRAQSMITKALAKLENYQKDLKTAKDIPELLPSQAQRETYNRHFYRQFEISYKEAQKNSIVKFIATELILLYGRKSICYIQDPNNQAHRVEIPLENFDHSIDIPNLDCIDPHGLDYMLRVFRFEGCVR